MAEDKEIPNPQAFPAIYDCTYVEGMTLQECKDSLLKPVSTPIGTMILYGINLIPNSDAIGLIFYLGGKQTIYFSVDCNIIKS